MYGFDKFKELYQCCSKNQQKLNIRYVQRTISMLKRSLRKEIRYVQETISMVLKITKNIN